jgi:hypothetical protein
MPSALCFKLLHTFGYTCLVELLEIGFQISSYFPFDWYLLLPNYETNTKQFQLIK